VIENGSVLLPVEAPWLADYLAELTAIPDNRWTRSIEPQRHYSGKLLAPELDRLESAAGAPALSWQLP
jgi:phage terminase large subunit-like protein